MRFLLLNPNTNAATTGMMLAIAREALGGQAEIDGMTAIAGAPVITDVAALAQGAAEVARMSAVTDATIDGLMIAAFGDPGLDGARGRLSVPVTGLAEASIAEAARGGRRFSIVTTTPALDGAIWHKVADCGADGLLASVRYTRSGPDCMADPDRLHQELLAACDLAVQQDGAAAIVIGGGPLAAGARALRQHVAAVLVEPIPAAIRAMLARADLPRADSAA